MKGESGDLWKMFCAKAAEEKDPERLLELVKQINDLLEAKEKRLRGNKVTPKTE
jgi:hypothetical protein